jgi:hypothetical protein
MVHSALRHDEGRDAAQQHLTLLLRDEIFGVALRRVREIRCWLPVKLLPNSPPHVLGGGAESTGFARTGDWSSRVWVARRWRSHPRR